METKRHAAKRNGAGTKSCLDFARFSFPRYGAHGRGGTLGLLLRPNRKKMLPWRPTPEAEHSSVGGSEPLAAASEPAMFTTPAGGDSRRALRAVDVDV